jgi:hypothetical protein
MANSSKMKSLGIFELPMTIRGQNFIHPVNVIADIKNNIIGIDFMHAHKIN